MNPGKANRRSPRLQAHSVQPPFVEPPAIDFVNPPFVEPSPSVKHPFVEPPSVIVEPPVRPPVRSLSISSEPLSESSDRIRLVEDPMYRERNLAENNIHLLPDDEQLPEHIASLIEYIGRDCDPLYLALDKAKYTELARGGAESDVEEFFRNTVFSTLNLSDGLKRTDRLFMSKYTVPDIDQNLKVSIP